MESFLQLFRELMLNHHHCGPSVQPLLMETILQQNLFTVFYAVHITVLIINLTFYSALHQQTTWKISTLRLMTLKIQDAEFHDATRPSTRPSRQSTIVYNYLYNGIKTIRNLMFLFKK